MKCVRKTQGGLQYRLLCFVSRAGGVSYVRVHDTLSPYFSHPRRTVADMDGLINSYCTCSKTAKRSHEVKYADW